MGDFENPYRTPENSGAAPANAGEFDRELSALDDLALKRLRNSSHTIGALGAFWAVLTVIQFGVAAVVLLLEDGSPIVAAIFIGGGILQGIGALAALQRPAWGRTAGLAVSGISLLGIPLGTALGILGLIAFGRGRDLFGPGRWLHRRVEQEWKRRKRQRAMAKRKSRTSS